MVKALHSRGNRGDPRRRLQPHRRGQPARARRSRSAASTTPRTTACSPDDRATTWTSRARQHPEHAHPRSVAADHGQPALLGARDARRRLPLRPGAARSPASCTRSNRLGTFFDIIHQDPVLSQVKLIAEPWDVGPGGYQVGNFPVGWAEWNDRISNCVRPVLERRAGLLAELASRAVRLERPVCLQRTPTRTRASTSSPRTTGSRWPTSWLRAQAQRRERRAQPRRTTRTSARTAASKARPT